MSDPYVYPGTSVLKNHLNLKTHAELDRVEADVVGFAFRKMLRSGAPGPISPDWHRSIHRALFSDIYPFAGTYRTIDIGKSGEALYAFARHLEANATSIFASIAKRTDLRTLDDASFRKELATIMGDIHVLHPFREGNTRTLQVATFEIARRCGRVLDWSRADPTTIRQDGTAAAYGITAPYERILADIELPRSQTRARFIAGVLESRHPQTTLSNRVSEPVIGASVTGNVIATDPRYVAIQTRQRGIVVLESPKLTRPVSVNESVDLNIGKTSIRVTEQTQGRNRH